VTGLADLIAVGEVDRGRLGGKAVGLGALIRAGLSVPPGFCVDESVPADDPAIASAYAALGGGLVAVRSSAVGEDEAGAAAAGVYATRLGVRGAADLAAAIASVRRSARAAHVRTYQPGGPPPVAVIVQALVEADVAGVAFTRDPGDETDHHLVVTACFGLGTTAVGGGPADRFRVDRITRQVVDSVVAHKPTKATAGGAKPVPADLADAPCLSPGQLHELTALALAAEAAIGGPCDVEWVLAGGRLWLLQVRPITASPTRDLARLREREIERLRTIADPRGTVWARYHLAESAPRPTPMTWGVLQTLLSVRGGYGRLLRRLGFDPDLRVDDVGFVQLIAGQPYLNLNLEARLDHRDIPYAVDVARLKRTPALALVPQRDLLWRTTPWRFWLRLPAILWRISWQARRLRRLRRTYDGELTRRVFPAFAAAVVEARKTDVTALSVDELLARFDEWRLRTLDEFAAAAMQPTVFAGLAMQELLAGADDAAKADRLSRLQDLLAATRQSTDANQPAALHALLRGDMTLAAFLAAFGHRGPDELELAQPRWREVPPDLTAIGRRDRVATRPADFGPRADAARRYCAAVALRETGRHYLMMGYSYLRELLLELDRRFDLAGGIFFLRPEELADVKAGLAVGDRIRTRRREYNLARGLTVPPVLFSDDLTAIGRPVSRTDTAEWTGRPVSPGEGEGPAVVAATPDAVPTPVRPGFVLVCPYVDAAWLAVFVHASAVVLETGTDLSHGAILLREFGVPAVAGVPGVMAAVVPGERLRVDGRRGEVRRSGRDAGG
jgi:pyruvate,water dikinase